MAKPIKAAQAESGKKKAGFELSILTIKKLSYIAVVDDVYQHQIAEQALTDYIEKWEKKNGPIPVK